MSAKPLLTPQHLRPYQRTAVQFQCTHPQSMLWVDMGLGKTPITLTSIDHLLRSWPALTGVLVVAPIRVVRMVWRQEALKWAHLKHLRFSYVTGSRDQRTRALAQKADVYLINYENLKWLAEVLMTHFISKGRPLPFNGVVWDEVSKMKNSTTDRVKEIRKILPHVIWSTGLTGTPASNGYKDLHGQYLVVDQGRRLGTSKTAFKNAFYQKVSEFVEVQRDDAEQQIKTLISDITLEMSAADYNPLPDIVVNDVWVDLPAPIRDKYEQLEKEFFLHLDSGQTLDAPNMAALQQKLLQISNGSVYHNGEARTWEHVHNEKLEALGEIIDEAQGQPVLCSYSYRPDAVRIMERFKHLRPVNLTDCKTQSALDQAMRRWKTGECPLMIGHPASMGHGIDGLQDIGNTLVWFGLNWSLELYDQFNARLRRQGQKRPVVCHRIVTVETLDVVQMSALLSKADVQTALRQSVREYRLNKGAARSDTVVVTAGTVL